MIQQNCARTAMTAFNCYGPTETTVEAVVAAVAEHARPVIGRPTCTTRAYVMDSCCGRCPMASPASCIWRAPS